MPTTTDIGSAGEQAAAEYLSEEGFFILDRNWRSGHCELDIIAVKDDTLHIIEVKVRRAGGLTTPEQAITQTKFSSLCKATRAYIALNQIDMEVQFDLVAIDSSPSGYNIRYIPNVLTLRW